MIDHMSLIHCLDRISSEYFASPLLSSSVKKKVVIVGYGSIGRRIFSLIHSVFLDLSVVSRSHSGKNFSTALSEFHANADLVVVCTETQRHLLDILKLHELGFKGLIYVEKPIVANPLECLSLINICSPDFISRIFCGYNFRYHLFTVFAKYLMGMEQACAGYLKCTYNENVMTWNHSIPWDKSYSTNENGGGACLTLSHILDQVYYLLDESVSFDKLFLMPSLLDVNCNQGLVASFATVSNPNLQGLVEIGYHSYPGEHHIVYNSHNFSFSADYKSDKFILAYPAANSVSSFSFSDLRDLSIKTSIMTLLYNKKHSCTALDAIKVVGISDSLCK